MPSYRVRNLSAETSPLERQRLQDALKKVHGVKTVIILPVRREVRLTYVGKEPNLGALKEACEGAGFMLAKRT